MVIETRRRGEWNRLECIDRLMFSCLFAITWPNRPMSPSPTIQRYADTLLELFQQELYAAVSQQSASRTTPCSPVHAIGHDDQEALSAQIDAQTRRIHELEQSLQDRDDSQTAANLDPLISDLLRSKRIFGALGLLTSDNEEFLFNEDAASILRNLSLPNPEHASPQSTWSSHTFLEALKSVSGNSFYAQPSNFLSLFQIRTPTRTTQSVGS